MSRRGSLGARSGGPNRLLRQIRAVAPGKTAWNAGVSEPPPSSLLGKRKTHPSRPIHLFGEDVPKAQVKPILVSQQLEVWGLLGVAGTHASEQAVTCQTVDCRPTWA